MIRIACSAQQTQIKLKRCKVYGLKNILGHHDSVFVGWYNLWLLVFESCSSNLR